MFCKDSGLPLALILHPLWDSVGRTTWVAPYPLSWCAGYRCAPLQQPTVAFHPGHLAGTVKVQSELKASHHLVSEQPGIPISLVPALSLVPFCSPAQLCVTAPVVLGHSRGLHTSPHRSWDEVQPG